MLTEEEAALIKRMAGQEEVFDDTNPLAILGKKSQDFIDAFCETLDQSSRVTYLLFMDLEVPLALFLNLAVAIAKNRNLVTIELDSEKSESDKADRGWKFLLEAAASSSSVRAVVIDMRVLSGNLGLALMEFLKKDSKIESLSVTYRNAHDKNIVPLIHKLRYNKSVKTFSLAVPEKDVHGLVTLALAEMIKNNDVMTDLDLDVMHHKELVLVIKQAIKENKALLRFHGGDKKNRLCELEELVDERNVKNVKEKFLCLKKSTTENFVKDKVAEYLDSQYMYESRA